ncbi:GMC family oxidoreductase N-terminal domain-containing protein [Paracoccus sp. N5]|uniref:GMC family oxidoreductase n=1 Tax=Paracoccus sp. N5 TaxID=1101189 RepID=UPI00039EBD10|nr:GMC family oxidoreductase N-terminal domain-containing protein [Paracoccus sp. N5]
MSASTYDYIVIGSGSAGGVIAGRLTESGKYKVLCLEAGTKGPDYIWSIPPSGNVFMVANPAVNWCYRSEPHESHGNRPIYVPRGKMLGGSSSLNGMVYNRGQRVDYDTWAQLGCHGWGYEDMLPFMKKLENASFGDDKYHGRSGPMKIGRASKLSSFYDLFIQSANAIGIPSNPDYSGERQFGVAMAQHCIYAGRRESTATQFLVPARKRPNMTILTGAEAMSLVMEGKRCVGVKYRRNGKVETVRASREVIVSCGAANSPKLLELSGIGNPEILRQHGIQPIHDLPGVGENLRDHYAAIMKWRFNKPGISIARKGRGWRLWLEALRYALLRKGFISQGMGTMRAFIKSRPELEDADILIAAAPFIIELTKNEGRRMSAIEGFFMYSHFERTESTGNIHIRSADPFAPPSINYRFLQTENDRQGSIAAVRKSREIVRAQPLGQYVEEELVPGPQYQTDEEILTYLREQGNIAHHMLGTCKMGNDPMAVVDERLRVHGIAGLRVADASIMPTMFSGNTSIPCMVIGEKCADMVLADAA